MNSIFRFSFLIIPILFCIDGLMLAQNSACKIDNLQIDMGLIYGAVLPHKSSIKHALTDNISGLELSLRTRSYSRSEWDSAYRYPCLGLSYLFTSLGNQEVFGNAHVIHASIEFPIIERKDVVQISYQFCSGISFHSHYFDPISNPYNQAISTPVNLYLSLRVNTHIRLGPRSNTGISLGLHHFSNGKTETPNYGINAVQIKLGYNYTLINNVMENREHSSPKWNRKQQIELVFSGGIKAEDQMSRRKYPIASVMLDYRYNFHMKYSIGAGIDGFYDQSLGPNMEADIGELSGKDDLYQAGVHGAFEFRYNKVRLFFNLGHYVYAHYYKYSPVYSRIGLRYDLTPHLFINCSIKAHKTIADYMEWGLAYRITVSEVRR